MPASKLSNEIEGWTAGRVSDAPRHVDPHEAVLHDPL